MIKLPGTPITDRAKSDLDAKTKKAYWNLSDWLRVKANTDFVRELADYVLSANIAKNALTAPTITTFPTADEVNQFLENIEEVRATVTPTLLPAIKTDWAAGFGAISPNYTHANQWESTLDFIMRYLVVLAGYQIYCGVASSGQVRFYQSRWRVIAVGFFFARQARTGLAITGASYTFNNRFRSG